METGRARTPLELRSRRTVWRRAGAAKNMACIRVWNLRVAISPLSLSHPKKGALKGRHPRVSPQARYFRRGDISEYSGTDTTATWVFQSGDCSFPCGPQKPGGFGVAQDFTQTMGARPRIPGLPVPGGARRGRRARASRVSSGAGGCRAKAPPPPLP